LETSTAKKEGGSSEDDHDEFSNDPKSLMKEKNILT
jgi:hypothetical protein